MAAAEVRPAPGTGRQVMGSKGTVSVQARRPSRPARCSSTPAPTPTLSSQSLPLSWDAPVSEISQLLYLAKKINNSSAAADDSPSGTDSRSKRHQRPSNPLTQKNSLALLENAERLQEKTVHGLNENIFRKV